MCQDSSLEQVLLTLLVPWFVPDLQAMHDLLYAEADYLNSHA